MYWPISLYNIDYRFSRLDKLAKLQFFKKLYVYEKKSKTKGDVGTLSYVDGTFKCFFNRLFMFYSTLFFFESACITSHSAKGQ